MNSTAPSKQAPQIEIIMDSGAYSAWRLGKAVDLNEYCAFLEANQDWIAHYVNLDTINPRDPEAAARASFDNLVAMRKRGLRPMPVFHAGENIDWLRRMLDLGCDYIGLASLSMSDRGRANDWYAAAWQEMTDRAGNPTVRVHGLGEGRWSSLSRFPWFSADSTSWVYAAQRTGQMTLESGRNVALRKDGGSNKGTPDVHSLTDFDAVEFWSMMAKLGIKRCAFEERDSPEAFAIRTYVTLLYYAKLQAQVRKLQPIRHPPHGFFGGVRNAQAIPQKLFQLSLVVGNNAVAASAVAFARWRYALVSFFYISKTPHYVHLRRFAYDPCGLCAEQLPFKPSFDILKEYVNAPAAP
jgi:hypothetical protein